jgi:hypothetical protein
LLQQGDSLGRNWITNDNFHFQKDGKCRTGVSPVNRRNAEEWHATIEAIDAGLIQSDDKFIYEAPEEGYQPKIQIDMPADANKGASIYDGDHSSANRIL